MKVSLNWIKEFTEVGIPVNELVEKIGAQLGAVEEVEELGKKYQGIVIAKVVSSAPHEDSDHLHVCKIDDGGKIQNVERDENGHVQVVCGAPNVHEGLAVAWLPPGTTVPESFGREPFVLEPREIRGQKSNGMLASPKELALNDNHDGILEIDPAEWSPHQSDIKPGADFAKVFGLDDVIIDIENKMFTHRPDLFGELGLAREIAGITGKAFSSPDWYKNAPAFQAGSALDLEVANEAPELVPRFMALAIKNITVKPSPLWLQCALVRMGQKPINNIVDVTNYIMLLTAQPTHAYDYDRLRGHKLLARMAKPGEQITLLNHKTYELDTADIVIADGEGAVGLAGVMGGNDSEVSGSTKNLVLECASFDMYAVRRSSMRHGVFTDALTRFNKGQSPLQNAYVLHLLMQSIFDVAGGEAAGPVHDINQAEGREWVHPPVPVTAGFVNARLGLNLSANDMKRLLENVEFKVEVNGDSLAVTAPFWRTDIEITEDVVEEVGRLQGYDKLPLELPKRSIEPAKKDGPLELKSRIRGELAKAGANEVLTYSFIHGDLLEKVGQDKSHAFQLANALSPDLQYYRLGLTPSLLEKVHPNIKAGHNKFALFELGKVHYIDEWDEAEPEVPNEDDHISLIVAFNDKNRPEGAAYYLARKYLAQIAGNLASELVPMNSFDFKNDEWGRQLCMPYEPQRSALILKDGLVWAVTGEFKASVRRALKLPEYCAGFELGLAVLGDETGQKYSPLPRFPKVEQDISLKVPADLPYRELFNLACQKLEEIKPAEALFGLEPLDIYKAEAGEQYKHVTFRLSIADYTKTLRDTEVNELLEQVAAAAREKFGAERL